MIHRTPLQEKQLTPVNICYAQKETNILPGGAFLSTNHEELFGTDIGVHRASPGRGLSRVLCPGAKSFSRTELRKGTCLRESLAGAERPVVHIIPPSRVEALKSYNKGFKEHLHSLSA